MEDSEMCRHPTVSQNAAKELSRVGISITALQFIAT